MEKLAKLGVNDSLMCPKCGEDYLHQGDIHIGTRHQEDGGGTFIFAGHDIVGVQNVSEKHPVWSGRRSVLFIDFTCEYCHWGDDREPGTHRLRIMQHKGMTYLHRVTPKELS